MKYKELEETIANLRACADWLESNPRAIELPAFNLSAHSYIYEYGKDENGNLDYSSVDEFNTRLKMRRIARSIGAAEKDYSSSGFSIIKKFGRQYHGGSITILYQTTREAVCKKVVKSTKVIPSETRVIPERVEEEVEWVCTDPILAG